MDRVVDLNTKTSSNYLSNITIEESQKLLSDKGFGLVFALYYKEGIYQSISTESEETLIMMFENMLNRLKGLNDLRRENETKNK
jgi:hypothetical protein